MPTAASIARLGHHPTVTGPTVTDSFNRANSTTSIGTADTGQAWVASTVWGIISNTAYPVSAGGNAVAYVDAAKTVLDVSVTVSTLATGSYPGLSVRITDGSNHYDFFINGSTTAVVLAKTVATAQTTLGSATVAAMSSGVVLRMTASGNTLNGYVNGALAVTVTDSTFPSQTKAGLFAYTGGGNNVRFDDFSVA